MRPRLGKEGCMYRAVGGQAEEELNELWVLNLSDGYHTYWIFQKGQV